MRVSVTVYCVGVGGGVSVLQITDWGPKGKGRWVGFPDMTYNSAIRPWPPSSLPIRTLPRLPH